MRSSSPAEASDGAIARTPWSFRCAPFRKDRRPPPGRDSSRGCFSRVGMCISQWHWLRSSLERPTFSEPNSNATRREPRLLRMRFAPYSSRCSGWCRSRLRSVVVPTTRAQSATASAHTRVLFGVFQDRRSADRRTCFAKSQRVRIDDAKPQESEVAHRARRRTEVQRIARADENDTKIVGIRG